MQRHYGRLLEQVYLVVNDLERSKRFYRTVLQALGLDLSGEGADYFWADELFVSSGEHPVTAHLAFQATDELAVERFQQAGLQAGGQLYPASRLTGPLACGRTVRLRDPDGNIIEAVYHGPDTLPRVRAHASQPVASPFIISE
ncbi:VOC family protein [Paludibacterium denitrificans]|uniref:VOC family protein n=1 Tax=Paludibacterium denitrificans TaxID=2675226 RepID=UPI001E298AB7|nr:VOC family protein [Paludibacterium denitrificans]